MGHKPKNGRWNAEMPLVPGNVEAFVPGNVEA
jgi:hypothetical protein